MRDLQGGKQTKKVKTACVQTNSTCHILLARHATNAQRKQRGLYRNRNNKKLDQQFKQLDLLQTPHATVHSSIVAEAWFA
jgi:hypothetical protein